MFVSSHIKFVSKIALLSRTAQISSILAKFRDTISTRSLDECIIIANSAAKIDVFDDEIIHHLLTQCRCQSNGELSGLSLVNLECLSQILSSIPDSNQKDAIRAAGYSLLDELKTRLLSIGSKRAHTYFINAIRNLTLIDVYDTKLMENLFDEDFITSIYGKNQALDSKVYEIDGYNRINLMNVYNGPYLSDNYLDKLCFPSVLSRDKTFKMTILSKCIYALKDTSAKLYTYSFYRRPLPFYPHHGNLTLNFLQRQSLRQSFLTFILHLCRYHPMLQFEIA